MSKLFDARSLEAIARALGDTQVGLSNSKIDDVTLACRFPEEEAGTKWRRIFNILANDQNSRKNRTGVLEFIRQPLKPAIYIASQDRVRNSKREFKSRTFI